MTESTIFHACSQCDHVLDQGEEFCPSHPAAMISSVMESKPSTPLRDAYYAAKAALDAAEVAYESDESAVHLEQEFDRALEAHEVAREAFRCSREPQLWRIRYLDGSGVEESLCAVPRSLKEALILARDHVEAGDWDLSCGTVWVDYSIDGEIEEGVRMETAVLQQPEPECTEDEHDWQSPHAIVGGLKENPGVWGHGAGLVINEVCVHCGCGKSTDTYATRPDNGTQGHTVVSYERGKYSDDLASIER
jgi:hypothetical protein